MWMNGFAAAFQDLGTITFPDSVNDSGTEQYFSVSVAVGEEYVACWSFGEDGASAISSSSLLQASAVSKEPTSSGGETADSEQVAIHQEQVATDREQKETYQKQGAIDQKQRATDQEQGATGQDQGKTGSGKEATDKSDKATTPTADSREWFFVSLFSETGRLHIAGPSIVFVVTAL